MENSLLKSRLYQSASNYYDSAGAPADYIAQYEEFKSIAMDVFDSKASYFSIATTLNEAKAFLEETISARSKKRH